MYIPMHKPIFLIRFAKLLLRKRMKVWLNQADPSITLIIISNSMLGVVFASVNVRRGHTCKVFSHWHGPCSTINRKQFLMHMWLLATLGFDQLTSGCHLLWINFPVLWIGMMEEDKFYQPLGWWNDLTRCHTSAIYFIEVCVDYSLIHQSQYLTAYFIGYMHIAFPLIAIHQPAWKL